LTVDLVELGRRAVACAAWKWLPGMQVFQAAGDGSGWVRVRRDGSLPAFTEPSVGTDLTDPATLGCLLARVREVWKDPYLIVMWSGEDWMALTERWDGDGAILARGATEAEALVSALELVPETIWRSPCR